jgi:effector-binding domain-containing protein
MSDFDEINYMLQSGCYVKNFSEKNGILEIEVVGYIPYQGKVVTRFFRTDKTKPDYEKSYSIIIAVKL